MTKNDGPAEKQQTPGRGGLPDSRPGMTALPGRLPLILILCYFPLHLWVLPVLFGSMALQGMLSDAAANYAVYAFGALYMVVVGFSLLRDSYDRFMDRPFQNLAIVVGTYLVLFMLDILVGIFLSVFLPETDNLNNDQIVALTKQDYGMTMAMAVFLAPLCEEPLFRAGIFGLLYRRSRVAAYLAGTLLFSLYHVWAYAIADPSYWVYALAYVPASFLLCLCYEWTDSLWGPIFLHMIVNAVAMGVSF